MHFVRPEPRPTAAVAAELEPRMNRAAFLRGGLVAGLATTLGPRLLASPAAAQAGAATDSPALSPLDLDFAIVEQFRPFDLLPRRFAQVRERFDGAAAVARATGEVQAEGQAARVG